jgi:hypothetical protein
MGDGKQWKCLPSGSDVHNGSMGGKGFAGGMGACHAVRHHETVDEGAHR